MPAAARVTDMVFVDDPDGSTDYGQILVGSPNVFINEGNAAPVRIAVPAATALKQQEALDDYVNNPEKYKQSPQAIEDDQIKESYGGTPDTSDYKMDAPPDPKDPPTAPTPNESGNKFSFVGGNQSTKAMNNPSGGGCTISYPSGWTANKGQIDAVIRIPNGAAVLSFLASCANKGEWVETGMGGGASNPKIVGIWKDLGFPQSGIWKSDQTAWCAGFVQYVLKQSGLKWMPEAGARNTIANAAKLGGQKIPIDQMQPGDIVLWSYSHVNFCYRRFS